MSKLTSKQERFAQEVVMNGGDKVKAREAAGYSTEMAMPSQGVDADKLYNHAKISLRIEELQKQADKVAKQVFTISVEKRLRWLNDITVAGLSTYKDMQENVRYENLSASTGAIKTMNEMIGVSDGEDKDANPLEITFTVNQPVKEVKITNADS